MATPGDVIGVMIIIAIPEVLLLVFAMIAAISAEDKAGKILAVLQPEKPEDKVKNPELVALREEIKEWQAAVAADFLNSVKETMNAAQAQRGRPRKGEVIDGTQE